MSSLRGDAKSLDLPQVKTGVEGELPATVQSLELTLRRRTVRVEHVETEKSGLPGWTDTQLGTALDVVPEELSEIAVVTALNVQAFPVNQGTPIIGPNLIEPLDTSRNALPNVEENCWRDVREPQI